LVQGFFTKVTTVIENLIVAGEGEELVGIYQLGSRDQFELDAR